MNYQPAEVVEVVAWGRRVGAVALDPASGFYAFEFDPAWVERGDELSPLVMAKRRGPYLFSDLNPATYYRLAPMVADSLPDRFGNALVDAWMLEHGVSSDAVTPLDRLAYAAGRSMGALEFKPPAGSGSQHATVIQLADLVSAARATLSGDLDHETSDALRALINVGTSAGGARAKAVIAYNPTTGQIRSGQGATPEGYEQWLIKLDGVKRQGPIGEPLADGQGFGRIEYAYYLMALSAGLEMSQCALLAEGPRCHFMTKRFDRTEAGERLHLQSLCGLAALDFNLPGAHSYAQYLEVVRRLELGPEALAQAYRRVVFNFAGVNRDDHTKNLAFLLAEQSAWRLAPAFDVSFSHNPNGAWTNLHQMNLAGKREGVTRGDLEDLADRFQVPGYRRATTEVLAAVRRWPQFAEVAGVSGEQITTVGAVLDKNEIR